MSLEEYNRAYNMLDTCVHKHQLMEQLFIAKVMDPQSVLEDTIFDLTLWSYRVVEACIQHGARLKLIKKRDGDPVPRVLRLAVLHGLHMCYDESNAIQVNRALEMLVFTDEPLVTIDDMLCTTATHASPFEEHRFDTSVCNVDIHIDITHCHVPDDDHEGFTVSSMYPSDYEFIALARLSALARRAAIPARPITEVQRDAEMARSCILAVFNSSKPLVKWLIADRAALRYVHDLVKDDAPLSCLFHETLLDMSSVADLCNLDIYIIVSLWHHLEERGRYYQGDGRVWHFFKNQQGMVSQLARLRDRMRQALVGTLFRAFLRKKFHPQQFAVQVNAWAMDKLPPGGVVDSSV